MFGVIVAAPASAGNRNFETLDGQGDAHGRTTDQVADCAAAIYDGRPHVWYGKTFAFDMRHTWYR